MATTTTPPTLTKNVSLTIDGQEVTVPDGTTILDAAKQLGIDIPVLCHDDRYDPVGVCRMCVVDVGARVYAAACVRPCEEGMEVTTASDRIDAQRSMLTELLLSDQPDPEHDPKETKTADNELLVLVRQYGVEQDNGIPQAQGRGIDDSNPVISVNHDACILCDRCVRACDDIQGNDVIGRSGKGYTTRIAFDLNDPMGESSCVTCGECVAACPTGALTNKPIRGVPIQPREKLRQVDTVCPYCGVGCALTYNVDDERKAISFAEGREQPGSQGPAVRQGPLRLGLRGVPAAADQAADPPRGRLPEGSAVDRRARRRGRRTLGAPAQARRPRRLRPGDAVVPRGDLGRGARPRRAAPHGDLRRRRPGRDRRLRVGQVLQRGGLPLPEADPHRLPHQQRRPLHAPVPRLERRRAVRGDRVGRGLDHVRRRDQRRRDHHRRLERDREPPGRVVVLQAGAPARHDDHLRRSARRQGRRPRRHLLPAQARHRRRVLQLGDARDHPARSRRRGVHPRPDLELRGAGGDRQGLPARARRADHRRQRRADPPASRGPGARRTPGSSTGGWASRSTRRAPTTRAA